MIGLRHFLLLSLFSAVHSSVMVISQEKQEATVGGEVTLQCRLQASQQNIFQITWQKETGNWTGPVAAFSKTYGKQNLGPFSNRTAQYTEDNLHISAITISPVTLEDQGCFKCIFNIYLIGANFGTICLDVYERNISEPILEIRLVSSQDPSERLHIVICSATGKPAPEISWNAMEGLIIRPETYNIINPNGTETVISNFTHRAARGMREKVTCVVSHPALISDTYLSAFLDGKTAPEDAAPPIARIFIIILVILSVSALLCGCYIYCKAVVYKQTSGNNAKFMCYDSPETRTSSNNSKEEVLLPNRTHNFLPDV